MDGGDWIALGAAIVSLGAMGVAIWQASEARGSREASERQANAAEDSLTEAKRQSDAADKSATSAWLAVEATEKAANAAEESVVEARRANRLTQEQLDRDRERRDEQDRPEFDFGTRRREKGIHPVTITMTKGPGVIAVHASYVGEAASPSARDVIYDSEDDVIGSFQADNIGPHRMIPGQTFEIAIKVPHPDDSVTVAIELNCREEGEQDRRWTIRKSITLEPPPKVWVMR